MCTILVLHGVHPELPAVVAANRDELYARPATGPTLLSDGPLRVAGGRDGARAGTWTGLTSTGLFVGVTNQRTFRPPDPARRSRGEAVLEALRTGSVAGVEAFLRGLDPADFNAFNLLFGEAGVFRVAYVRPEPAAVEVAELPPGIHVLANDRIGSAEFPKADRALALARPLAALPWPALAAGLARLLADHALPPPERVPDPPPGAAFPAELVRQLQAICIHTPSYGTRSATIAALAPGRVVHWLHADGPPCTAPFVDQTGLVAAR